ncbi:hypothetical protein EDD99_7146 [Streptomyces sp. 846.5]|nr:hypothetical protein [Streptomyces sp. 846.5]TDT95321.1 hypothetical protein EDD99_7146 [Streptomyces sp. 846.5]
MGAHYVTAGSVLVGLLLVGARGITWYRKHGRKTGGKGGEGGGKRKLGPLGPFLWTMTLGTLSALAAGGILGKTAQGVATSSNKFGDQLLSTIAGANSPSVTRPGIQMLGPGGSVLLIVLLFCCVAWFWMHGWRIRVEMVGGYIAGVTLGPTAGLAGIAGVVLAPIFNYSGNYITGLGFHG